MEHPLDQKWLEEHLSKVDSNRARLARTLGRDRSAVTRLLNGERKLKLAEIPTIAEHLRVPVDAVLEWAGIPTAEFNARKGLAEMAQAEFKQPPVAQTATQQTTTKQLPQRRHPAFGALKGLITIKPGVDLTEPAFEDWRKLYGEDE
ncbi:hypothetical protein VE25_03825 [Devosia geojensis]|uniref:HTH cro/C1-type domain-containing protein n=1 Tax=Devosia geojensis TaxID=443610 RepID=A0A0F5FY54_9HYPH|nr:helix-turn-helix transcriptional regulator [Devosia geojensis]KKB13087.1 hypothetical protein VE25_03825 [Devosia geojensis]